MLFYDKKNYCTKLFPTSSIRKIDEPIISKKINVKYLEDVKFFLKTIRNVIPNENLYILYNNLEKVSIKTKHTLRKSDESVSYYDCIDNKICIKNSDTIWHELFHLSSGVYDNKKNIEHNGFRQTIYKPFFSDIGFGLNEGYTQLLTERYFKGKKLNNDYNLEKNIAKDLELLIGKEKMEKLYFEANIYGLVETLKKFVTERDIYDFIKYVDLLFKLEIGNPDYGQKDFDIIMEKAIEIIKKINNFFIKFGFVKNQYVKNSDYAIISDITIRGKTYIIATKQEMNDYYNLISNEYDKVLTKNINK